jgi:cobalt-zinc-cadmium efflux system protein
MAKTRFIDHKPEPHGHHEHPDPQLRPKAIRRLKITFAIGASLFFIEAVGSWFSHSLALLADSFHVLADLGGVFVTLLATHLAERPQTAKRSYGYYRLEVLAALFNGCILLGLAFFIMKSAYGRLAQPTEIHANLMLWVAIFGLAINVWMLFVLRPAHDHNLNLRGAYLHVLGDTISSIAVIAGGIAIYFTGHVWIDSVASIVVALIISSMAVRLVWDSIHVLLEGTPKHMDPDIIEARLRNAFPQIINIHDFHIWEITAHLFAMTAHVEAKIETLEDSRVLIDGMNAFIKENYGIGHTTFQVESSV